MASGDDGTAAPPGSRPAGEREQDRDTHPGAEDADRLEQAVVALREAASTLGTVRPARQRREFLYEERCAHSAVKALEFVAAAAGAGLVVPFVKAIATKAGEDCYQALRNLIPRQEEGPAGDEIARLSSFAQLEHIVRLTDPDSGTVLLYLPPLPDDAVVKLAALKPGKIANRVVIWDKSRAEWVIRRKH